MKMRIACVMMVFMLTIGVLSCAVPAATPTAPAATPTTLPSVEPTASATMQPTAEPAPSLPPDQAAISNASTADELRALVDRFKNEKNYEALYHAAVKLIEIDPGYAPGYTDAATALLEMSKSNYAEINSILSQGCKNAKENADYIAKWVQQNDPKLNIELPFISDYSSADEINAAGITSGNLSNALKTDKGWQGGLLTSQGDWIYLTRPDENLIIYKMRTNGSEYQRICEDSGSSLNVVGDYIYFCNLSDGGKLYMMRTDGSGKVKVTDDGGEFLSVSDGWLYYSNRNDNGVLYKVRTDGSERTKLTDTMVIIPCVSGEWVYYVPKKEGGFWRVRTDGSGRQLLTKQQVWYYCISDGWIYYLTDKKGMVIEKMRPDGKEQAQVFRYDGKISTFNMMGDHCFISVRGKDNKDKILKVRTDTSKTERVYNQVTEIICTAGKEWLYFADWNGGNAWNRINTADEKIEKIG